MGKSKKLLDSFGQFFFILILLLILVDIVKYVMELKRIYNFFLPWTVTSHNSV